MKNFSSNSETAHQFSTREYAAGGSGNLFFNGDTIYSYGYHFPIAKYIEIKGQTKVLFTLDTYSNSTAKHISLVRSALSHYSKIYLYDLENYSKNVERIESNIKYNLKKLGTARNKENYINEILRDIKVLNNANIVFGKKTLKKNNALLYDLTKKGINYFDMSLLNGLKDQAKKRKEAKKLKEIQEAKKEALKVQEWKTDIKKGNLFSTGNTAYLRYNNTLNVVETSKGIKIDIEQAKQLFNTWKLNSALLVGQRVNDTYKINKVTKDSLIVGCHTIDIQEANYISKLLNW